MGTTTDNLLQVAILSGTVAIGTSVAYLLYQHGTLLQKQQKLSNQNAILTENLLRLEKEVSQLKQKREHFQKREISNNELSPSTFRISPLSSDNDDIFLDASDLKTFQEKSGGAGGDLPSLDLPGEESVCDILNRLEDKIDEGTLDSFQICYEKLSLMAEKYPSHCELHWKLARSGFMLATEQMSSSDGCPLATQQIIMQKSKEAADTAVRLEPTNGDAHKWAAIIQGSATQFLPVKDQIKSAYKIKEHITSAIKHKPDDALVHHMLGRWCYSVYMLSWVERKVAAAMFAEPPTASMEEALACFLKAEDLNPKSSVDNSLYLAKCYIANKDYKKASEWLRQGGSMKVSSQDDQKSLSEIHTLLPKYSSY